jgi:hypothetical protein
MARGPPTDGIPRRHLGDVLHSLRTRRHKLAAAHSGGSSEDSRGRGRTGAPSVQPPRPWRRERVRFATDINAHARTSRSCANGLDRVTHRRPVSHWVS